jgi:hypothetical protein
MISNNRIAKTSRSKPTTERQSQPDHPDATACGPHRVASVRPGSISDETTPLPQPEMPPHRFAGRLPVLDGLGDQDYSSRTHGCMNLTQRAAAPNPLVNRAGFIGPFV